MAIIHYSFRDPSGSDRTLNLESYLFHWEGFPVPVTPHRRAAPACVFMSPVGTCHHTHPVENSSHQSCLFSLPDHLGHRAQDAAPLPHFILQVKEHEGSSKEGCAFIQQELLTCCIFLHVSSQKQLSQPPGTSHSFHSSSALFVQCPCSHTLNSALHRDKLSMLSLVML